MEGIRFVRAGRQWTVHWSAYRHYRNKLSPTFDVIIDEVNTIPFFTPLWSDIPAVMFIHQLAREVWWYESRFPISALGFMAEPYYLRLYRKTPVVTVSASTEHDLRKLGFTGQITVIPEGVEAIQPEDLFRPAEANFLYVGRIAPSKRIEHLIMALAAFRDARGTGTLWLVGAGSERYRSKLITLSRRMNVEDNVVFRGRVGSAEKHRLMARAQALLLTSVREGWGLVVSEANACGTPALVYDVPGLRDSVRNEVTGLVVPPTPSALSNAMTRLIVDASLRMRLSVAAQKWSATLSFDLAAGSVAEVLEAALAA